MNLDPLKIIEKTNKSIEEMRQTGKKFLGIFFSPEHAAANAEKATNRLKNNGATWLCQVPLSQMAEVQPVELPPVEIDIRQPIVIDLNGVASVEQSEQSAAAGQ